MKAARNPSRVSGTAVVELALVLPLLLLLILGGIDFALQFHVRHRMTNAAREGARRLAVQGGTVAQATAAAMDQLAGIGATFTVTATPPAPDRDAIVRISVPRAQISLGVCDAFLGPGPSGDVMVVQTTMRNEQ